MSNNNTIFYDKISEVLFHVSSDTGLQPIYINARKTTDNKWVGIPVASSPLLRLGVKYVNYCRRQRDKKTGKFKSNPLFPYQLGAFLKYIYIAVHGQSDKFANAWGRQGGKSEVIKLLLPFVLVFVPQFKDIVIERYNVILGSNEDDNVTKLFKECKTNIYKAVELHNSEFSNGKLLLKKDLPKLADNSNKIEIDKQFPNGEIIPYAQCFAITCSKQQDSLTSHFMIIDEAGLIKNDLFETSISPFSTSTAGIELYFGVPNQDSSSLLHVSYMSKEIKNIIYTVFDIYDMRLLVNKDLAEAYWISYQSRVRKNGLKSAFIQWNYHMNFMDLNGKFINRELLENSNILLNDLQEKLKNTFLNDKFKYKVGGLDVACKKDYKVLTIGTNEYRNDTYISSVSNMKTYNKEGKRLSIKQFAEEVALDCKKEQLDMLCIDATGQGGWTIIQQIYENIKLLKINTVIIPYSYNQYTKPILFTTLENSIFSGNISLLKEFENWSSEKLIEEMLYMIKESGKKDSIITRYYAPDSADCSDDHMNSLALFNRCLQEAREAEIKRKIADDGYNKWKIRTSKFKDLSIPSNIQLEDEDVLDRWIMYC